MLGGLIVVGLFVALIALFAWWGRDVTAFEKELPARVKRALPGRGVVLGIWRGSVQNQGSTTLDVQVRLRVEREGSAPYEAVAFWLVRDLDMSQLQPGTVLDIKVDAEQPLAVYSPRFQTSVGSLLAHLRKSSGA